MESHCRSLDNLLRALDDRNIHHDKLEVQQAILSKESGDFVSWTENCLNVDNLLSKEEAILYVLDPSRSSFAQLMQVSQA